VIIVCPLSKAQGLITTHGVREAVSMLAPGTPMEPFLGLKRGRHLKLDFHDIVQPTEGLVPPGASEAQQLLVFFQTWDDSSPLLIHCWAGISRSTASAYVATCLFNPGADEEELALELRRASPSATPNRLIVQLADAELGRGGRMVRAIDRIGRGENAFEGTPFTLTARRRNFDKPVSNSGRG
jgi:predicted protein tyrosine phosphatase